MRPACAVGCGAVRPACALGGGACVSPAPWDVARCVPPAPWEAARASRLRLTLFPLPPRSGAQPAAEHAPHHSAWSAPLKTAAIPQESNDVWPAL